MEIIDELSRRSGACTPGRSATWGLDGAMAFNIAIRTLIVADGWLHLYAGGGIVADSDPQSEYEETCAKALGLRRALGAGE